MTVENIAEAIEAGSKPLEKLADELKNRWLPTGVHQSLRDALYALHDDWVLINVQSYLSRHGARNESKEKQHRRAQLVEAIHRHLVRGEPSPAS